MTAITGTSTRRFGASELLLGASIGGGNDMTVATGKLFVRRDGGDDAVDATAKWW